MERENADYRPGVEVNRRTALDAVHDAMLIIFWRRTMAELDVQQVVQAVSEYLRDQHPGGLTLKVVSEGVRKVDTWWQVPVRPDAWPAKTFELYDTLAEVETRILEDRHLNVLFALTEPEIEQAA
jgi:hypothetical protein